MTMTKRRTKKYLAARVLCTLLLGTYLVGGYGEPVAWGAGIPAAQIYEDDGTEDPSGSVSGNSGKVASAWGVGATASGNGATAWGGSIDEELTLKGGTASGLASTAFGVETVASGSYSTAWGVWSKASNNLATAWGVGTRSTGSSSTAWGDGTLAIDDRSTAFGSFTQAGQLLYGTDKIEATIERYTKDGETKYRIVNASDWSDILDNNEGTGFASYEDAFKAKGLTRTGEQATAFGENTKATGTSSTAFGIGTEASGSGATAWGGYDDGSDYVKGGTASGLASTAFGKETTAMGDYSTAFGYNTRAESHRATAFGHQSTASGDGATAWGGGVDGDGISFKGGTASGLASTAFGTKTTASGFASTAWGLGTKDKSVTASGDYSTAFGVETTANTEGSTAWGAGTTAGSDGTNSGNYATAFGLVTTASGFASTAWGDLSTASGYGSTAFGKETKAIGDYSTAFGISSEAKAKNSLAALGGIVETVATNSAAIGEGATASVADTVALGSKSVASREAGATDAYLKGSNAGNAWVSTHNAIAVGNDDTVTRQITGVAAGSKDTDAVNVAQLKEIAGGAVYTAGAGIDITDNKVSVKADTNDFSFASGELKLNKNGVVKEGDNGVVTGDTVYKALQAQSASIDSNKANVKLDNITNEGKNVVRELAKESVKTIAGEHTTVTEGTAGNAKTYAVNVVTDGAVASGNAGIVTGGTVFTETRAASDGNYIKAASSAAGNLKALDTQVKTNADAITANASDIINLKTTVGDATGGLVKDVADNAAAIGTTADGTYVKAADSVGENLNALDTQLAALAGGAGAGLDEVNHRISNLDSKINKVGAGAAALAALHPLDTDNKFTMAAGFGNYRNANAMALGMFYRPTDKVMFSVGGAMGNGENMINAGVSFALDKGVGTSKAAMARTIKAQGDRIAEQDAKIQSLEAYNAKLEERLAALEAKIGK